MALGWYIYLIASNWIELDIEGAGGAGYQIQLPDRAVIRLEPHGIAGTMPVYSSPQITGRLDSEGKARVELPDEFADKAFEIKILLPQDWSAVWMNLWAGIQLVSGAVTLTVACTMEVGSLGASTLISLGLAVWSLDQMHAASRTLVGQQETGTGAAALFEWAGMPAQYSELAAGALPLGGTMMKGMAKMTLSHPAIRSVTINAVRQGDKLVHRSIEFIAERVKHRYVFKRTAGTLEAAEGTAAANYFGQQRQFWSSEPILFNGNKVYQRNDLFNPHYVDAKTGKTNLELMSMGRAPIGNDGKPINLHHMLQRQNGPIAEVTQSFHKSNHKVIHINDNSIPSGIDRAQFNKWRAEYWMNRAEGLD